MNNTASVRVDIKNHNLYEHRFAFVPTYEYAAKFVLRYFEAEIDEQAGQIDYTIDDINKQNPEDQDLELLVHMMDYLNDCIADWTMASRLLDKRFAEFNVAGVNINIKGA